MIKRCQHCETWNNDKRRECRKCFRRLESLCPSDVTPCSRSSDTPECDNLWEGGWNHTRLWELSRKLERERDYWKNKRMLELESMMPLHHHEWSEGAKVKTPGKEWRLECCQCGAIRQKPGSLVILENAQGHGPRERNDHE